MGESELIGADVGKSAGEQPAAEPGQQGAERKGDQLRAVDVDPVGAGGEFVVADRAHGSSETGVGQAPDEISGDRHDRDNKGEKRLGRSETGWSWDRAHPVRTVRETDRVDEDDG